METEPEVSLREVLPSDLPVFYANQLDPVAGRMADMPARDWDAFSAHWNRILADLATTLRTILYQDRVAGNIVCFPMDGQNQVGYWLGREFWGKGIATLALKQFLEVVRHRPLYAHTAGHNLASQRVLEKCGFVKIGEVEPPAFSTGAAEADVVLVLHK